MKLKGEEYIPVRTAFEVILNWDKEKREETGENWFVRKENGEYVDRRPRVEKLYNYLKGLPQRSWKAKDRVAERKNWDDVNSFVDYLLDVKEKSKNGGIPEEMTVKIDEDNYLPFETTLCAFHSFDFSFEREEANEIIKNVLDRLLLHERRSHGGHMAYLSSLGEDVSDIENPFPDEREPEYHRGSDAPSFIELDKVGKSERELERKIPPRLSDQQKFILAKLAGGGKGGVPERYFDWITNLSYNVAEEFGNSQDKTLTERHRASFSRSLRKLKERGLIRTVVDRGRKNVVLTEKGLQVSSEIKRRVEDGRYSLEFKTL
ncbi:hypothetical protein AKJ57_05480 [candidate division MSBL1 archaeon SCGC-AAA259A05]|uniref:Uncharacterized protein n=1 Tax=candidate division MSBL1 archaeon SCGC-AAA259A05 TaxID=1698259 RepID=A0A133U560_9EURY|nr:hypothetical protein AKJ57_05480 [candidate division MSBL1 archaeon SCGC-AAA259A05]